MSEPTAQAPPPLAGTADAIAAAVTGHPRVVRLAGGRYGALATHLPGRKVTGVRVTGDGEPVDIGVVLTLGDPLPGVVAELRERVRAVAGKVPVNVEITDVEPGESSTVDTRREGA
ncbi:hypothetical protein BAY61_11385 [Prauserella marina]|uniref:Uncharacterized protein n=1 Tax=Prauserella marina TaxID=530584 RepID=A0A222VP22_9PSEU|nr:hypothetical protein [Prauserella marina]ASR35503.1 hypothetical protein BAY61_11385 [Prauserella marina]PWV84671.1 hypothetical protein DES30_101689 [Prauserella marina]SDC16156.1 hypothetical protein SAMN05421630_101647 [Prauserella marina]